jgi:hypothetical protein
MPVHRMHCKSGWILIRREVGDFLTKLLLFREDDFRRRLCQGAVSGAGQGLGFPATRGGDGKSPMLS